jgi:dTDP-glucose 4,6-dehydratase
VASTAATHRLSRQLYTRIRRRNRVEMKLRLEPSTCFVSRILLGRPLTIYGEGSQTRSIQYVDDLIEGTFRLMQSSERRPVNIGNPQEHTVHEIAEMVIELSGSESELVHEPLPEDDPKRRCPDIARAREVLVWEPRVPVREGLKKTLEWFAARFE